MKVKISKIKPEIPDYVKKYFWEIDTDELNIEEDNDYIIARLLEYGDLFSIRWMFKNFNKERIKKVFLKRRGFSFKTENFWKFIFNVKNKDLCLRKQLPKTQKMLWRY